MDETDQRVDERLGYLEATLQDLAIANPEARRSLTAYRITYGIRHLRCTRCREGHIWALPSKYGQWCHQCGDFVRHAPVADEYSTL